MAGYNDIAFDAMNNAVSSSENSPKFDMDKRLIDEGLNRKELNLLYSSQYPDVTRDPSKARKEHWENTLSYWDPETYRTLDEPSIIKRLKDAKNIKGDLVSFSEKAKFKKLTTMDPDKFEWDVMLGPDEGYSESPFRTKGGFEKFMKDKGYYDETKTGGLVAAIQRFLPGGKKGMSRRFADPRVKGQKSGSY